MKKTKRNLLPLCCFLLLATACGCGRRESMGARDAPSRGASADEGSEAAVSAPSDTEKDEPQAPAAEPSPMENRPPRETKRKADVREEDAFEDEGDARAPKGAIVSPESSWQELTQAQNLLERSLSPERLSCGGARPHVDAICEIAARICDLERRDPGKQQHCERAQATCEEAKSDYQKRCE